MRQPAYILLTAALALTLSAAAQEPAARLKDGTRVYPDTAIYQGINLKLDIGNAVLEPALSDGQRLSFEAAMNVRLKQRYYPTFELGYAQAKGGVGGGAYDGLGGFARVGLDINGLKKHPERLNSLLVGVRLGTALQSFNQTDSVLRGTIAGQQTTWNYRNAFAADCWGEVVAGVQVQVWEGLQMGWYVRLRILFTRTRNSGEPLPYYIPGYGIRDDTAWGFNYYIGYKL
ncbi:MAG: hypothetical protein IJ581_00645 [Paludibacteraceae bacterium]|nr:hypothetical protein [Paludibacteraceae bacterium]